MVEQRELTGSWKARDRDVIELSRVEFGHSEADGRGENGCLW
jgi:hypothetical protein